MSVNDGTGEFWQETDPANSLPAGGGALEIRDLRLGVRLRVQKEHVAPADGTVGGEHLEGSAKIYNQGSAPTVRPDGVTPLDNDDTGRLWVATTGELSVWTGTGWQVMSASVYDTGTITNAAIANSTIAVTKMAVEAKMLNFSYAGGTNPRVLTFNFNPNLVVIFLRGGSLNASIAFAFQGDSAWSVTGQAPAISGISWGTNTVTINTPNSAINGAGQSYTMVVFG